MIGEGQACHFEGRFLPVTRGSEFAIDRVEPFALRPGQVGVELAADEDKRWFEALHRSSDIEAGYLAVGECPASGSIHRTVEGQDCPHLGLDAQLARGGFQPFDPGVEVQYVGRDQPCTYRGFDPYVVVAGKAEDESRTHAVD